MAFTAKIADLIAEDKTGLLAKHESWERVPLSEVAGILNGAPFDSARFSTTSGVPLARIRDVIAGETSTFYTGEYDDAYLLSQGDLLIGMDGDFNSGCWGAQRALLNQRVCKLTPNVEFYDKKLLGYVLPGYLAAINANTPSITVKHLSSKTVGEIELPLPPRAEQERIVEKLEELLSDLDAGVAELKVAQRKLAQYRQSLLKAAAEGALTADWRAAHGKPHETGAGLLQRILSERRTRWEQKQLAKFAEQGKAPPKDWQVKYPEPVAPDLTDLPALPEGWVWSNVDCLLSEIDTGKSFKCEERPPQESEVGVVKVSAVTWGEYDEEESKTCQDESMIREESFVREGDFLFSRANTIDLVGACVIARRVSKDVMLSDKILRLVFVDNTLNDWLLACLRSDWGRKHIERLASGNQDSMRNIGQERLRQIPVPLPPASEIEEALRHGSTSLEAAKAQEEAIEVALRQSAAQRKNILKAAFAGQLVPQDPNDEPASELLARIRAERASNDGSAPRRRRKTA